MMVVVASLGILLFCFLFTFLIVILYYHWASAVRRGDYGIGELGGYV